MMKKVIQRLKNLRKQQYLQLNYEGKYAFVGIGSHSLHNLYPVLSYLRVDLKYLVTRSAKNAATIQQNFSNVIATTDLDRVLTDEEVIGVFICADPKAHFGLAKRVLLAGKNVFIEKPPCANEEELQELIALEKQTTATCVVGMQKRYAPVNQILKKKARQVINYNYQFLTGLYPEGDAFLDIFIHPIDLVQHLFGTGKIRSALKRKTKHAYTCLIHLEHVDQVIGSIEISTAYTWEKAKEELIVNTSHGIYTARNTEELFLVSKPGSLFKIPKEKLLNKPATQTTLFARNNFNPILLNNQVHTSGYYTELKNFIEICEGINTENYSPINDMVDSYSLLSQLKQTPYV